MRDLFDIMDVDRSGFMDIREFFECFNNIKGQANSKQLLQLQQHCIGGHKKNFNATQKVKRRGELSRKESYKLAGRRLKDVFNSMLELHPDPMTNQSLRYERGTSKGHQSGTYDPGVVVGCWLVSANFERLVLGCNEAKFSKQILV